MAHIKTRFLSSLGKESSFLSQETCLQSFQSLGFESL